MLEMINNAELKLADILTIAMTLFIRNIKKILTVVLVIFLPISILQVIINNNMMVSASALLAAAENRISTGETAQFVSVYTNYLINNFLQVALNIFLLPVGTIAIAKIGEGELLNAPLSAKEAIGEGMNCIGRAAVTGIVATIFISIGILAFIVPGVYFAVLWMMYMYAVSLRKEKGRSALRYSKQLVEGRWFRTLGFAFVIAFICMGWEFILSIGTLFGDSLVLSVIQTALAFIAAAFGYLAYTVLFLNRESVVLGRRHLPYDGQIIDGDVI